MIEKACPFPRHIAVPSCVIPAHIPENAVFLSGKTEEVGLCFFQSEPCLAYGDEALPPSLAELPLAWHVHLPLDLTWEGDGSREAEICCRLLDKIRFLAPRCAVLHPPFPKQGADAGRRGRLLADFARRWREAGNIPLLIENTPECDLSDMAEALYEADCGVCLDIGHLLGSGLCDMEQGLLDRVRLIHLNAPGTGGRHLPLTCLTPAMRAVTARLLHRVPKQARRMLELFSWSHVEDSVPVLLQLEEEQHTEAAPYGKGERDDTKNYRTIA